MIVIIQVTKYEITPIQEMHNTNDSGANFRKILLLQHLTVCPCSGKLLDSFDGALKIKKYLGHFKTRVGPFFRKFIHVLILMELQQHNWVTYLRTSGIVRKNRSSTGKNNAHQTWAKKPPSGRCQGKFGISSSSESW